MTARGPHALGAVRVDAVAWAANGRVSLRAMEILLASDEDTKDAQVDGDAVRIDLDGEGKPQSPVKIATGAARRLQVQRAPAARLEFPRLRDERAFWRAAEPKLPDDKLAIVPMAVRETPPFPALDMRVLKGEIAARRDFLERSMNTDSLTSGLAVVDGRHIALASTVTGSQWAAFIACEFNPATRVATWCHVEDVTTTVHPYFSPDHRLMLLTMTEVQEDAFRLLDLPAGGVRCKVSAHPAERALHTAFDHTGSRLAVLTRDGEMWVYDVRKQPCEATVAARFALPDTGSSGGVVAFSGPNTLVWLTDGIYIHAFDAASGLVKWSQEDGAPRRIQGTRAISVSPDGRLFATAIGGMVALSSALTGVTLSGVFSALRTAAGIDGSELICGIVVEDSGVVRVEVDRELLCSPLSMPELRTGRGAWTRLAPDDAGLGFEPATELWRRTVISKFDGKSPVPLGMLLTGSPTVSR